MTVHTKHPRKKSAIVQGTAIVGRNGLPVDTCVSFDTSLPLIENTTTTVTYSSPTVTVDVSVDLSFLLTRTHKNTQILAFEDAKHKKFYVDKNSINDTTKTFDIYSDFDATDPLNITFSSPPVSINLAAGWVLHELKWTNRLAVSSDTIIENVEFGGVDMQMSLDGKSGDSVRIVDIDGDELDVKPDGSIDVNATVIFDPDVELDVQTTHLDDFPNAGDLHDSIRVGDGINLLQVTDKKEARTADTLHCGGTNIIISVNATPVKIEVVSGTPKSDRKEVFIQPRAKGIFWGFNSDVDTTDGVKGGAPLGKNQPASFSIEANTPIFLVGPAGGVKIFIAEA